MQHYDYIFTGSGLSALMTVNEMILSGKTKEKVLKMIKERTFRGLEAKANFVAWKRC